MASPVVITETWVERWRAVWRRPRTITALIPVAGATIEAVHARLLALAPDFDRALATVPGVHTFRLVAVPPGQPGGPPRVLVNCVFDRPLAEHMPTLVAAAESALLAALEGSGAMDADGILAVLARFRIREHTFHLGSINRSVDDILAEQRLLEAIEQYVDRRFPGGSWDPQLPAEQIRGDIRAHVRAQPAGAKLPTNAVPELSFGARVVRLLSLLVTFAFPAIGVLAPHIEKAIRRIENRGVRELAWLAYGLWWIYGALFTGIAMLVVRCLEIIEPDVVGPLPDPAKVKRLEDVEDLHLKNAVLLWMPVRDTWVRRILLRIILWGSERGCRHFWTRGALADIDTIHYARIMGVDGNRTLLFMSDYDGSLDRYLMDFFGVGSSAVIPISSNVGTCPKTRWLFYPDNRVEFVYRMRLLIRDCQLEIPVWYSAYPNLSVRDVLSNAAIRDGLFAEEMSDEEAAHWLARL